MANPAQDNEFGKRLRVARVWAGYTRQDEFGDALAAAYPGWPVRRVAKRIEQGERALTSDERAEWAQRVAEFTGVPEWFMTSGWAGAEAIDPIDVQLEELRAAVERHERLLLKAVKDRPAPAEEPADRAARTLREAAALSRQKQDARPARKPSSTKRTQG